MNEEQYKRYMEAWREYKSAVSWGILWSACGLSYLVGFLIGLFA